MLAETKLEPVYEELEKLEKTKPIDGFKRGTLKKEFEKLATNYGLAFSTVRNKYYNEIKDKYMHDKKRSMDQDKTKVVGTQRSENIINFEKKKKPPYLYGDRIKVRVTNIAPYGVFVETLDGGEHRGLIHISEVKDTYIGDLNEYFEINDELYAMVKLVNRDHKIEFSTLKEKITLRKKPSQFAIKKEIPMKQKEVVVETEKDKPKIKIEKQKEEETNDREVEIEKEFPEAKEVVKFLNNIVGMISPKAKTRLKELIKKHGVFKFTVAMMQAEEEFENDLSMYLMSQIQKKLNDGL